MCLFKIMHLIATYMHLLTSLYGMYVCVPNTLLTHSPLTIGKEHSSKAERNSGTSETDYCMPSLRMRTEA